MTSERTVHGVCNLCEAICGLLLTIEDGPDGPGGPGGLGGPDGRARPGGPGRREVPGPRVTGVRGNPDDPLSRGHICPKGVALADVHTDPDRLRRPVRRLPTAPGQEPRWEEIGWAEALEYAVTGLADLQERHGRDSVGVYLGNPNVHSLGSLTHGTQLTRTVGSRNTFSATSVDQLPHQLVSYLLFGHQLLLPVPDIDRTDLFLVFGANPMASNGSLMTAPAFPQRVRELKARGGRMVVVDPRRTETAKVADEHHFVRPGTDAAVLLAMLHVLFAEDLARTPGYVDHVDRVREAVAPFTPELAEEVAGMPADTVRRLARELAQAPSAAAYGRVGISTHPTGTVCTWALVCLNLLTGNLDRPGGMMVTRPAVDLVGRHLAGRGQHGRWHSRVRGLPETAGELPVSALAEEILTPGEGQVRGMLTIAGNPVLSTPDGKRVGEALAGLEFMVAVDIYLNETTRHADVILPPTTALERDHYDLAFHHLAVRDTARFTPAVLPKPPGTRHDWEIFRDLALGLTARRHRKPPLRRRVVAEARLRLSPTRIVDLLLRSGERRLSVRSLRRTPAGVDLGPLQPAFPRRLQTRDHRVDLAPQLVLDDVARVRDLLPPPAVDGELLLIGRRHQRDCNSWMHNLPRLTRGRPRHHLLMHPDDLDRHGLEDGARVRVTSRVGSVEVEVQATDDMMAGVVSLPHGYGHATSVGTVHAAEVPGVSINDLTDPERLDVSGNAAFTGVPVTVTPASSDPAERSALGVHQG